MKLRKVIEVKGSSDFMWNSIWELKLECGHTITRMRRRRGARHETPAPKRAKCIECTANETLSKIQKG